MKINKPFVRQLFLYGVIGGGSALLDFYTFTFLNESVLLNKYIANIISVHIGIAMSFTLNMKFNFKKTDRIIFRVATFYMTGVLGLILSQAILWIGDVSDFPTFFVKFVSIFVVAAVQFILNKLITFNK